MIKIDHMSDEGVRNHYITQRSRSRVSEFRDLHEREDTKWSLDLINE